MLRPGLAPGMALAIGLVLSACGSKVAGLYTDPSFTADAVRDGGLATLGVVWVSSPEEGIDPLRFVEQLHRDLEERREDLRLALPGETLIAAGPEAVEETLEQYRRSGRLTAEQIDALRGAGSKARYVLLGRVDTDWVERTRELTRHQDDDVTRIDIELISRREMGVNFDVFDLQRGDLVWTAYFQRVEAERGERLSYEENNEDIEAYEPDLNFAVQQLVESARHPEPPARSQLMKSFARDVARHLPGGK